ncbi:MAG: hypothetical protein K8R69_05480, partial [Deltaproteobacteria bacterium]|nr:hypothetical protein [Deltaproteobacteria bacterium]
AGFFFAPILRFVRASHPLVPDSVANANIARSLRVLSVERGHDPRRFTLLPFGGAGPLHAAELAEELSIPSILIPKFPGLLSAYGMAYADWRRDYVKTLLWKEDQAGFHSLRKQAVELENLARRDAAADRIAPRSLRLDSVLDLRYQGQSYEIEVPLRRSFRQDFSRAHFRRYGYKHRGRPIEIVNLRLRAQARTNTLPENSSSFELGSYPIPCGFSRLYWRGRYYPTPIFLRESLPAAFSIEGPAIVAEFSATTFVPPGWRLRVERGGELLMTRAEKGGRRG